MTHARALFAIVALTGMTFACSRKRNTESVDTLSDQAAAESAKALASMSQAPKTHITLSTSGERQFSGPMDARATCTYSESNGEHLIQIEGFARTAQLSFVIVAPREGPIKVSSLGKQRGSRITTLDIAINSRHYTGGGGQGTITDPLGRKGSLTASHFVRSDGGSRKHSASLTTNITWECE